MSDRARFEEAKARAKQLREQSASKRMRCNDGELPPGQIPFGGFDGTSPTPPQPKEPSDDGAGVGFASISKPLLAPRAAVETSESAGLPNLSAAAAAAPNSSGAAPAPLPSTMGGSVAAPPLPGSKKSVIAPSAPEPALNTYLIFPAGSEGANLLMSSSSNSKEHLIQILKALKLDDWDADKPPQRAVMLPFIFQMRGSASFQFTATAGWVVSPGWWLLDCTATTPWKHVPPPLAAPSASADDGAADSDSVDLVQPFVPGSETPAPPEA